MSKDNFDDLNKFFDDLQKKMNSANGEVSFPELFNPNFMTTFTNFNDIGDFFSKSPFEIHSQDDFENIDKNELDKFVKGNTRFSSWEEMKNKAGEIYLTHKMGL